MTSKARTIARTDPAPPRDYPHADWQDDGPYAVPPGLRPFYAEAEPHTQDVAAYLANGVSLTEETTMDVVRVVSPGTATEAPVTVTETVPRTRFRDLSGAADYREWLHLQRCSVAAVDKHAAERQAARAAAWAVCAVCQVRNGSVSTSRAYSSSAFLTVTGCPTHLLALVDGARDALAARAAAAKLPDGTTVGETVARVVADLLDAQDGAA